MQIHRTPMTVAFALLRIVAIYFGWYFASVTPMQISYGNPSGSRIAFYVHPWQQALFGPVERFDRWLFPARWHYNQLQQTDTPPR